MPSISYFEYLTPFLEMELFKRYVASDTVNGDFEDQMPEISVEFTLHKREMSDGREWDTEDGKLY